MQFLPIPLASLMRPTSSYQPSIGQCKIFNNSVMCLALSRDFQKYCFCVKLNEVKSVELEMKKLENTDTTISSSSEEEI